MTDRIEHIQVFVFERQRDENYLGEVAKGEQAIGDHHVVRHFNGTIYPRQDRSVVLKLTDADGVVGWGETYGLVAPKTILAIIEDLIGPYLKTLDCSDPAKVWDALYDLQRVRGYWGGYLADALAAIDIALWDIHARKCGKSLQAVLGKPGAYKLHGYVSGLPQKTRAGRIEEALRWKGLGFDSIKIPVSATDDGDVVGEFAALREALGDDHRIALDLHWAFSVSEVTEMDQDLEPYNPWFLEAPVKPEDIQAQVAVGRSIKAPLALGEEWRSEWDYIPRVGACSIVQPEMGHTGVTQFMRMAKRAVKASSRLIPHATIGLGIFMSASLRASVAAGAESHEFQHTIFGRNAELLDGATACQSGAFEIPDTLGHGVTPNADGLAHLTELVFL
ncbi:mandelate racemase/muconate lactonizing enzyme family protein [Cognatishimia sp. WU-CL00825]|uniref:enolase C-terminal domain-like protein n=1 Tax=Cognatishimia sp. WU-CL00825 TaxID=3127658 RepID=UPI003103E0FB